jgi:hypothetical protein
VPKLPTISQNCSLYMRAISFVSVVLSLNVTLSADVALAYDLKLLIDKNVYDVIKPNWITDSVALGEPAPLRKKSVDIKAVAIRSVSQRALDISFMQRTRAYRRTSTFRRTSTCRRTKTRPSKHPLPKETRV